MSSYWKSVGILAAGTLLSQLIFFIFIPIITRLYLPSEYGLYTSVVSYSVIASTLVFAGLERALPLTDEESLPYFIGKMLKISIIYIFVSLVCCYFYVSFFQGDSFLFFFSMLISIFFAYINALSFLFVKYQEFKNDSLMKVYQALLLNILQSITSYLSLSAFMLCLSDVISKVIVILKYASKPYLKITFKPDVNFNIRKYKSFYTSGLASNLIVSSAMNLPIILAAKNFGASSAAILFLAMKFTSIPASLIGTSIGKVYLSTAADIDNKEEMKQLFTSNFKRLFVIALLTIPLYYISSFLLKFFLGSEWNGVVDSLLILMFLSGVQLIANPLSITSMLYNKQHYDLIINVVRIFAVFISFGFSSNYLNYSDSLKVYVLSMISIYTLSILVYYYIICTSKSKRV
ncbi:lipopolysaccharide biosynthesis protein [Shewanella algae]|uniref:lipopolysaccharide biosynthesis protein n=1 Tax=Shewanella algae TaxID=38313 RepID=UPI0031F590CD